MRLSEFDYYEPETVEQAVDMMGQDGKGEVIAGGTDLLVSLKQRLQVPDYLVDLENIPSLREIKVYDGVISIGALCTLNEIINSSIIKEKLPAFKKAAGEVGSPLLRSIATVGGNICLNTRCRFYNQSLFWRSTRGPCYKAGGEKCHLTGKKEACYSAFSADIPPVLIAHDCKIRLTGPQGVRTVPLQDFYTGDARFPNLLLKGSGEVLTSVEVPLPHFRTSSTYRKFRLRDSIDFPLIGAAVLLQLDENSVCEDVRVVCTGTPARPVKIGAAQNELVGSRLDENALFAAAKSAAAEIHPLKTDLVSPRYVREVSKVVIAEALSEAGG